MRKAAVAMAAAAALMAACGGTGSQPAGSISVTMSEFKFDPATITVPHGKVVFFLQNIGTTSHDMIIQDGAGNRVAGSELLSAGDTFVFTVDNIDAGTYTYFCDQPGHRDAGMHGTLTVT